MMHKEKFMIKKLSLPVVLGVSLCLLTPASAHADEQTFPIQVKGGLFVPSTITVPAGQKVKLVVSNTDTVQAEFESYPLEREQKIDAGASTDIFVGPLEAGQYPFFDDNNPDAKGTIIAK